MTAPSTPNPPSVLLPYKPNTILGSGADPEQPCRKQLESYRLTLFSSGLLSKWGFGDGDMPDALLDAMEDAHLQLAVDWHIVLRQLVRKHLVPALAQALEVYDIETLHNPIRAQTVDGIDVDDWVLGRRRDEPPALTPEYVEVTWPEILQAATEAAQS